MPKNKWAFGMGVLLRSLFLFMVVAIASPDASAVAPNDYQAEVQKLLDNSQYREAVQLLGQVSDGLSDAARQQALMQQGEIYYYYLEDYRQALASYRAAYDAAPGTQTAADALYRRGLIYMDKLQDKDSAVKEFEVVLNAFPDYPKRDELKHLLKNNLSRAYKLDLIQRKNYWKFFIALIDAMIIFFWKIVHEYASVRKFRKFIVDIFISTLVILNIYIWWMVIHAEAQLDMLALGIIK